jgi:hypothetical protein
MALLSTRVRNYGNVCWWAPAMIQQTAFSTLLLLCRWRPHQSFGRRRGGLVCVVARPRRWHRIACGLAPSIRGRRARRIRYRNYEHEYLVQAKPTASGRAALAGSAVQARHLTGRTAHFLARL